MAHLSTSLLMYLADEPARKDVEYKKGELVFFPEAADDMCRIIVSGYARVYTIDKLGAMNSQIFYSTGDIFPLYWIIDKPNSSVFVDALTDCVVAKLPHVELQQIIAADSQAANLMIRQITEQFAMYASRVGNLSYKYSRQRVAYSLLLLAYRFGEEHADTTVVSLPSFSQHDIAATINLYRESTNRELQKFEQAGSIITHKNCITILDKAALRNEIGDAHERFYFDE